MRSPFVKTVFVTWDKKIPELPGPVLIQQFDCPGGFAELSCQYLEHSYSEFEEDIRFRHSAPLISRLILVEAGEVFLEFSSGNSTVIGPGTIYLLPSNHPFCTTYRNGCITKGFHLYLRDRSGLIVGPELPDVLTLDSPEMVRLLRYVIGKENPPQIHAALMTVLAELLHDRFSCLRGYSDIPAACLLVIDRLRKNPSLELRFSDLADEMHISLPSLSKQFRRSFGQSMQQYRGRLLLEKARRLLGETNLTAGEIAGELGFSDLNYFFVFFRKAMGMTPLAYRRETRCSATAR